MVQVSVGDKPSLPAQAAGCWTKDEMSHYSRAPVLSSGEDVGRANQTACSSLSKNSAYAPKPHRTAGI